MSSLSGFDSEAVGFESVSQRKRQGTSATTQTSEFDESGVGSQTSFSKDCGSLASPSDLNAEDDILREYPPPGLNAFLRRVVPGMLEQLEQNERETLCNSSDSDEEEALPAKLLQEIKPDDDATALGSGDHQPATVLSLSWSSSGRSLAAGVGRAQHARWCEHEGGVRVHCARRAGEKMERGSDVTDTSCVTVVLYHPSVASLLAYGTAAGEVAVCAARDAGAPARLSAPDAHAARRVSALHWPDAPLASALLAMHIQSTGRRRGAADQILVSAGADGSVRAWLVNANAGLLESVVCYAINGLAKEPPPDISCLDFIKSYPLRPCDEKVPDDIFVVGTTTGGLYVCGVKGAGADPVRSSLSARGGLLQVAFSAQRPGVLAALSADELCLYHVDQIQPLKVFCLDEPASCMAWLADGPGVALGLARGGRELVRAYECAGGRRLALAGVTGSGAAATAIAVDHSGSGRIACADETGTIRVWEVPARRGRLAPAHLEL